MSTSIEAKPLSRTKNSDFPVVLVHGFKDTGRKLEKMARALRAEGRTAYSVTVAPSFGQIGIDELAAQLAHFIETKIGPHQHIDLVGFSMGGLVCRYYVQRLGGLARVDRLITVSSPHNGTLTAYLLWNRGSLQMRPDSAFLRDLNGDIEELNRLQFTSIWTPLDLMIIPATSSHTRVGRELKLWMPLHPLMVWHPSAIRAIADILRR